MWLSWNAKARHWNNAAHDLNPQHVKKVNAAICASEPTSELINNGVALMAKLIGFPGDLERHSDTA